MKRIILCLLCLPALALSQAVEQVGPKIAGFEAGVVCAPEPVGTSPAPGTIAGTTHVVDTDPPFVSQTRRVPAALGIGFGVKAVAADPDGLEDVIMVVTHPPMGKDRTESQSFGTQISGLSPSFTFYQFDEPYERVYGLWQITAFKDDEPLYTVSFDIVPPAQVPELARICGYENLLS